MSNSPLSKFVSFGGVGPPGPPGPQGPPGPAGPSGVVGSGSWTGQPLTWSGSAWVAGSSIAFASSGPQLTGDASNLYVKDSGAVTRATITAAHGLATFGGGGSDYKAVIGPLSGFETQFAALYLLPGGTAISSTNEVLACDGTNVTHNGPSTSGYIQYIFSGDSTPSLKLDRSANVTTFTQNTVQIQTTGGNNTLVFANTLTAPTLNFGVSCTTPSIGQVTPTSDVATNTLTISSQAPWASAVTNLTPGNLVLKVPSPVGAGAAGKVSFNISGFEKARIDGAHGQATFGGVNTEYKAVLGPLPAAESSFASLHLLPGATAPSSTNEVLACDGTNTTYNTPGATGYHGFIFGGVNAFALKLDGSAGVTTLGQATINFAGVATTTTAPGAGGAGALPATPAGYATFQIGGTNRKIAYY